MENRRPTFGEIVPPWCAVIFAVVAWASVGIVVWDFVVGTSRLLDALIFVPIFFLGLWSIFSVADSLKVDHWFKESKRYLAAVRADNDRTDALLAELDGDGLRSEQE